VTLWRRASGLLPLVVLIMAWALLFPPWADDWDGLGFLSSIHRFDLAHFSPHPPGYPVYVALLKLASVVTTSPIAAARCVAVLSGAVTYVSLWVLLEEPLLAASVLVVPLVFHTLSGVGSEAPALAFAAIALATAVRHGSPVLLGIAVGLGLGVRLSWAPFYVPLLFLAPRGAWLKAATAAVVTSLVWVLGLVVSTGLSSLIALMRTQAAGHFERWGGTVLEDPQRLPSLARDIFVDGFGVGAPLWLEVPIALGLTLAGLLSLRRLPEDRRSAWRWALVVAPYLVWVTLGQNLRAQPRHVLPLVLLAALWLARSARGGRLMVAYAALALLFAVRSGLDAESRRTIPPAGIQLAEALDTVARGARTIVFTGASGRFLDGTPWQERTHTAATIGDVTLALSRMPLMDHALVTSEIGRLEESPVPLAHVATFCRPERLDRRLPCMDLYDLDPRAALLH
jgi:hypothetical protein